MKNFISNKYIYIVTGIILVVLLYLILAASINNEVLFPNFSDIGKAFINLFSGDGSISILVTVGRLLLSLVISFIIASGISVLYYFFRPSIYIFKPLLFIFKVSPIIAVVLYIQVLTKGSYLAPYLVTTMVMIPILVEANITAIDNLDKDVLQSLKLENRSGFAKFLKVIVPMLAPYIIMSLLQSISLGLKVVIMVEYFCYVEYGIGTMLYAYLNVVDIAGILSIIILAVLISLILETIIHIYKKKLIK